MRPTSLYIHIPWCIRKCPYCDFNSHKSPKQIQETQYIEALIADMAADLDYLPQREIATIFIGGGTPSLFSGKSYEKLLQQLQQLVTFAPNIEITLEANPGTVEKSRFQDYHQVGINRLSLGIQSFDPQHLKSLGRIHDDQQAHQAIEAARLAGFDNINLDLMHSLPHQTVKQGLDDLHQALNYQPEHLSWYQLTLEPNTVFYKQRPALPHEDIIDELEKQGMAFMKTQGYQRYEISAFCKPDKAARHNMNYWLFGDYYGIGAGAHGKITQDKVTRTHKHRQPKDYVNPKKSFLAGQEWVSESELVFEFMLNVTRLQQAIPLDFFTQQTKLPYQLLLPALEKAAKIGLITLTSESWQITDFGRRYTNNLQALFLPSD